MPRPNKRSLLTLATLGMLILGGSIVGWMLQASLQPTDVTLRAHLLEVDLANMDPGQALRVDWEGMDVFIVRRTPAQIAWLENYTPPLPSKGNRFRDNPLTNNRYRSINPEYLVVGLWRHRQSWSLPESDRMHYLCEDFQYSSEPQQAPDHAVFPGGFFCASSFDQTRDGVTERSWLYDPAGRHTSAWIPPLPIPRYRLDGQILTLGAQNN